MISCYSNRGEKELLGHIVETPLEYIPDIHKKSKQAFITWSSLPLDTRIEYIQGFLDEYTIIGNAIAISISKEIGKPITQALADIQYDISYMQWYIDNATHILEPELIYQTDSATHTAYFEPKGVAAVISPRNYPTSQFIWQVIPPLLAGNSILYKSASACMWTGKILSDLIIDHLPEGVFIPLYGDSSLGQALIDLHCDLTIFTGSTHVGKLISTTNGAQMEISHLELGGSAPGIICKDAIIDNQMMQTIDYFRVWHNGQICDGLKRIIIHESRLEEFIQLISSYFKEMIIGNPLDPVTRLGPVINNQALIEIQKQIQSSTYNTSIQTITLGTIDGTPGAFMPLSLLVGNDLIGTPVMKEEVFGPVLPIVTFKDVDEAITIANDTIYGLGGYLWGNDKQEIDYICKKLHTGNINVNNTNYVIPQVPFGGYTPSSGNFREHGWVGLRNYCEMKVVSREK